MKTYQEAIQQIRARGYRLTRARQGVLKLLWKKRKPLAASDMQDLLAKQGIIVNKTTVYRELEFLAQEKHIEEVRLHDGRRYYECVSSHHHHLICVTCKSIDDVILENEFEREERQIEREAGFKVLNHSLEFFGVCAQCQ
ncbi:MAG: Fur family transcriptional regulator [Candidatus Moranbacteria bacterium]|nr:Fur family transcriptional regulator [Candidatus Moranbacteria bacterium]